MVTPQLLTIVASLCTRVRCSVLPSGLNPTAPPDTCVTRTFAGGLTSSQFDTLDPRPRKDSSDACCQDDDGADSASLQSRDIRFLAEEHAETHSRPRRREHAFDGLPAQECHQARGGGTTAARRCHAEHAGRRAPGRRPGECWSGGNAIECSGGRNHRRIGRREQWRRRGGMRGGRGSGRERRRWRRGGARITRSGKESQAGVPEK